MKFGHKLQSYNANLFASPSTSSARVPTLNYKPLKKLLSPPSESLPPFCAFQSALHQELARVEGEFMARYKALLFKTLPPDAPLGTASSLAVFARINSVALRKLDKKLDKKLD